VFIMLTGRQLEAQELQDPVSPASSGRGEEGVGS